MFQVRGQEKKNSVTEGRGCVSRGRGHIAAIEVHGYQSTVLVRSAGQGVRVDGEGCASAQELTTAICGHCIALPRLIDR